MSDNNTPLISVLMLTYNQEKYIKKAINSVFNQMYFYPKVELLIIDDGSGDETVDIIDSMLPSAPIPTKLIKKKHQGVEAIARNFNHLIKMSNGEFITFLSGDDEFTDDRFREQSEILLKTNAKIIYGNGINIQGTKEINLTNSDQSNIALFSNDVVKVQTHLTSEIPVLFIQSVLVESEFLKSFVPFDEDIIADDWVFNINTFSQLMKNNWEYRFINKPFFLRNIHHQNTSRNKKIHFLRISQVLNRYFQENDKRNIQSNLTFKYAKQSLREFDIISTLRWLIEHYKLRRT